MWTYGQLVIKFNIILNVQPDISFRVQAHNCFYSPKLVLQKICKLKIKMHFYKTCSQQRAEGSDCVGFWGHRSLFFLCCCFEMPLTMTQQIFKRNTVFSHKSYYCFKKKKEKKNRIQCLIISGLLSYNLDYRPQGLEINPKGWRQIIQGRITFRGQEKNYWPHQGWGTSGGRGFSF